MKKFVFKSLLLFSAALPSTITYSYGQDRDATVIRQIFDSALVSGRSYGWLEHMSNKIGARMSGTVQAAQAVEYTQRIMKECGFDKVYLQEVMVPHWERGEKEQAHIMSAGLDRKKVSISICALGGSVGTVRKGITAEVVEVQNFEELDKLGEAGVKGKIVFFNRPMLPTCVNTFEAYGGAVNQRGSGASRAAKYGAIGVLVRSMSLAHDHHAHTGAMRYADGIAQIPAAAISTNDADQLQKALKSDKNTRVFMKMNCKSFPEEKSYNVVGEITGTEFPNEIITVGGHLDSWDLGTGAHDDGAGCVQSIEALRLLKINGIRPKRTLRAVMFMNEEFGLRGGQKYYEIAKSEKQYKYLAAIESDRGGFTPRGFSMDTTLSEVGRISERWKTMLAPYGFTDYNNDGSGADIYKLKELGTLCIGFLPDSQRYFDVHHAETDVFENVNRRELELGGAGLAALIYLISQHGL